MFCQESVQENQEGCRKERMEEGVNELGRKNTKVARNQVRKYEIKLSINKTKTKFENLEGNREECKKVARKKAKNYAERYAKISMALGRSYKVWQQ